MKDSIRRKLERLDERFEEISRLLAEPGVIAKQNQFRELSMEYARLGALVARYRAAGYRFVTVGQLLAAVRAAMALFSNSSPRKANGRKRRCTASMARTGMNPRVGSSSMPKGISTAQPHSVARTAMAQFSS